MYVIDLVSVSRVFGQIYYFAFVFFFFNVTATTEIYTFPYTTLFRSRQFSCCLVPVSPQLPLRSKPRDGHHVLRDRKSTRLNSSHSQISYAVFCLKKKKIEVHELLGYLKHDQDSVA